MSARNTTPANAFEVLRRLHNCNWSDLANRLGITTQTLRRWRDEGPGPSGAARMALLCQATLTASQSDWLTRNVAYDQNNKRSENGRAVEKTPR